MDTIYTSLRAMPLRRGPRRLVGGVCGGIAYKTGWDIGMVRLITLIALILPIISLPAYLIAWVIIPRWDRCGAATSCCLFSGFVADTPRDDDPGDEIRRE